MSIEDKVLECVTARWKTGREITQDYEIRHGQSIGYGTVYITLRRLAEQGLVEWMNSYDLDGPVRSFRLSGGKRAESPVVGVPEMA